MMEIIHFACSNAIYNMNTSYYIFLVYEQMPVLSYVAVNIKEPDIEDIPLFSYVVVNIKVMLTYMYNFASYMSRAVRKRVFGVSDLV